MRLRIYFALLLAFFAFSLSAQVLKPVKWEIKTEKVNDKTYFLVFKANITKGWTVYSQYTSDEGPVPTLITYEEKSGVKIDTRMRAPAKTAKKPAMVASSQLSPRNLSRTGICLTRGAAWAANMKPAAPAATQPRIAKISRTRPRL